MGRTGYYLVATAHILQVLGGFAALGLAIALCDPYDAPLWATEAAACLSGFTAVAGGFSMLALSQSGNIHWMMVLMLDLAGFATAAGAGSLLAAASGQSSFAWDYGYIAEPGLLWPSLVFDWIIAAMLLGTSARSFLLWHRSRFSRSVPEVQVKEVPQYGESWAQPSVENTRQEESEPIAPIYPRFSRGQYSPVKDHGASRPLSTVESTAHWSDIGSATLTAPSIRSSDTKEPPTYTTSPVPSRATTRIHRKPV